MKLNINKLGFEIEPVPGTIRPALMTDEVIQQGTWRDAWAWDASAGEGRYLTQTVGKDTLPLGNAVVFFVPRATPEGAVVNNAGPARKMKDRFLEATGTTDVVGLLRVMSRVIPLPRLPLPFAMFRPLNEVASYKLKLFTDFSAVRLHEPSRNLSAYLLIPGQVAFHHEITAIVDEAGYEKVIEAEPRLKSMQPHYVLPAGSKAGHDIRRMAVGRRIEEYRPLIEAARDKGETVPSGLAMDFARLVREWKALQQPQTPRPVEPGSRPLTA